MKKHLFLLLTLHFVCWGFAQQVDGTETSVAPPTSILSPSDEILLRNCPVLKLTASQRSLPLPTVVDNSQLPFMTPIYSQSALECGQSSSIVYTFSYEMNCRRNTPNNNMTRRYPSHFAWNFCNGGSNRGVSFMDTWQVLRTAGTPTAAAWGGSYDFGGPTRWFSGYDLYYNAMKNRIVEFCAIPTDSEEGILTLKHWIDNHLRGDENGGLANFYSTHVPNGHEMLHQIPAGTPHAGMWIVPNLQTNVNHAQTIVGYDDSICWDYNNDGRYTNDEDINHDGVVDVHDWEIGAVIFCNSFGTGFANQGYCYLPYRKLAELPEQGGIWNACVYVVDVKDAVSPRLTYKVTIDHTCRNRIKLMAGVSTDPQSTRPQHLIEWNVFNFQGGEHYMQGDTSNAHKTLELGLDVSQLLQFISPNQPARFYLAVVENDEHGVAEGHIQNFSILDYQGNIYHETTCPQTNVTIVNNDTTFLAITSNVNFSLPRMEAAPNNMVVFRDYSYQIPVEGGAEPYRFEFTKTYEIEEFASTFPTVAGTTITLSNNNNGYSTLALPFEFPFYDNTYDQLCIYADGYITFRNNTYNWPFLQNADYQVLTTEMIAPFRTDLTVSAIRALVQNESVTIFVQAVVTGQSGSQVNYAVKIYANGIIEYYYGDMNFNGTDFLSALSRGDSRIFQKTDVSSVSAAHIAYRAFRFTPPHKIDFLSISRDGILSGMATEFFMERPVSITCFDNNDLRHDTILLLSAEYDNLLTITDVRINAGNDEFISVGEMVELSFTVRNLDSSAFNNCNIRFITSNPRVTMLDSTEYFGYIGGGNTYTLNRAIRFTVNEHTPHRSILDFAVIIDNDRFPQTSILSLEVLSHPIKMESFAIKDGDNQHLDPGDIDTLSVWFSNVGNYDLNNLRFELRLLDQDIQILSSSVTIPVLAAREHCKTDFVIYPTANFDPWRVVDALIDIYVDDIFCQTKTITLIGDRNCEGFEEVIPPTFTAENTAWIIDSTYAAVGLYSIRSGTISNNDTSSISHTFTALRDGEISFYYKVSSENNYDWLYFFIDGQQQNRWSGVHDWTLASYIVEAGEHTLTWKYIKDYSVNSNLDAVWIDELCLPLENPALPNLQITPSIITETFDGTPVTINLQYTSTTPIYALFENTIENNNGNHIGWASLDYANGSINALQTRTLQLTLDLSHFPAGVYNATLTATVENGNVVHVPIEVTALQTNINEYTGEDFSVKVFPNPTSHSVTVDITSVEITEPMLCSMYDLSGRKIHEFYNTENQFIIPMDTYVPGFYFLKMKSTDGRMLQVIKIVKR